MGQLHISIRIYFREKIIRKPYVWPGPAQLKINHLVGKNMRINFHIFYLSHYNTNTICICVIIMEHRRQVHSNWAFCCCHKFRDPTYFDALLVYARVSIHKSKGTRRKQRKSASVRSVINVVGKLCLFERDEKKKTQISAYVYAFVFIQYILMIQICTVTRLRDRSTHICGSY